MGDVKSARHAHGVLGVWRTHARCKCVLSRIRRRWATACVSLDGIGCRTGRVLCVILENTGLCLPIPIISVRCVRFLQFRPQLARLASVLRICYRATVLSVPYRVVVTRV